MSAQLAQIIKMLVTAYTAALVGLAPLSFVVSVLALEGLEKLDLRMRRNVEKRVRALQSEMKQPD